MEYQPGMQTPNGQTSFPPPPSGGATQLWDNAGVTYQWTGTGWAPSGGGAPTFSFDYTKELQIAYEQLKPFYQKVLEFVGGNLDLAKRVIEYTYSSGMRQSREEYESKQRELAVADPREQRELQTTQNKRGVLTSGFGATERSGLSEMQALRREAEEKALANREESLIKQKGFDTEQQDLAYKQKQFETEREQRQEASTGIVQPKFQIKSAEYQAGLQQYQLQQQQNAQAQAAQQQGTYIPYDKIKWS